MTFSCTTISRVYREWFEKEKISSEQQLCGRKCLVDIRDQRRMGRLVRDDRKATVTQIITRYNQGMQNTISERTTRRTLKQMGYSSVLAVSTCQQCKFAGKHTAVKLNRVPLQSVSRGPAGHLAPIMA